MYGILEAAYLPKDSKHSTNVPVAAALCSIARIAR